jgi:hypothetical protein
MDLLYQKEGAIVFYQVFLLFSFIDTGCLSLKKWKNHGKAGEATMNNKEEFCLDFFQEFGLRTKSSFPPSLYLTIM